MTTNKNTKFVIRTKEQIADAMVVGNITISKDVLSNPNFRAIDKNEPLGFKLIEGSDFEVVEFYPIKDNQENFKKVLFGID